MLGLSILAAKLAYKRHDPYDPYGTIYDVTIVPRAELRPGDGYVRSREYYLIIDRISRGEKP